MSKDDKPSILRQTIPNRVLVVSVITSFVAVAIFFLVTPISCNHRRDVVRNIKDMANLRQSVHAIAAYAADHNGMLPSHVDLIREYGVEQDTLISPHDVDNELVYEKKPEPGWYQFGSYWFLSAEHLNIDDVEQPSDFMLVYRTPRPNSSQYFAGFLDSRAEAMSSEDFAERMYQQGGLAQPPVEEPIQARYWILMDE